jgi:hypothetical protein
MHLFEAFDTFPEVAKPIIIKSDALRLGMRVSDNARAVFRQRDDITYKGFHLFTYDREQPVMFGERIPVKIYLEDGTPDGTAIQVRTNSHSPYLIDVDEEGCFTLSYQGETLGAVRFDAAPRFYSRTINGTPMAAYVYAHGDLLFVTANKFCHYFSTGNQCLFCNLVPTARAQKGGEPAMLLRKDAGITATVLDVALHEHRFRHIMITGGTFTKPYRGLSEIDWYTQFLTTLRKRIGHWPTASFQIQALDDEGWKRIRDTGIPSVQPNIEVLHRDLFPIICPGKAAAVGYDEWIRRTIRAVEFFGRGNVNPNIVAGVEMAQPWGFKDVDEAVASTVAGYDLLMAHGVLPRMGDFWCIEADSKLAGAQPPPLAYYIKLGKGYTETREKYGFVSCAPIYCRWCGIYHSTEYDFEYWHGHGPASREAELKDPGVSPH